MSRNNTRELKIREEVGNSPKFDAEGPFKPTETTYFSHDNLLDHYGEKSVTFEDP